MSNAYKYPEDFNVSAYETVQSRVGPLQKAYPVAYEQYAGAWNAVRYRLRSCVEHDQAFVESIRRAGVAPETEERYFQERELYGFFTTGLSTIESFYYALYAIGAMVDPKNFSITTAQDLKGIKPRLTAEKFARHFSAESIVSELKRVLSDPVYDEWKTIRDILAHRASPGRSFCPGDSLIAVWKAGPFIDTQTTALKREWLAQNLKGLLKEADLFTANRLC